MSEEMKWHGTRDSAVWIIELDLNIHEMKVKVQAIERA